MINVSQYNNIKELARMGVPFLRIAKEVNADVYERHSLIITTNIDFSNWSGIFSDTQMATVMVDRLVHHGHLFRFDGESYRLMH